MCVFHVCYNYSIVGVPCFQVIRTPQTSEETFKKMVDFGQALGKSTVECKVCYSNDAFTQDVF